MSGKKGNIDEAIKKVLQPSISKIEENVENKEEEITEEKDPILAPKGDKKLTDEEQMERRKAKSKAYKSIEKKEDVKEEVEEVEEGYKEKTWEDESITVKPKAKSSMYSTIMKKLNTAQINLSPKPEPLSKEREDKVKKSDYMTRNEEVEEEMKLDETAAADTLKPAAKSVADPNALSASKIGRMSGVMSAMSSMSTDDQVNFFNQVMAQYGPGKTYGVGDNSEKNKSTLDMKPSAANGAGPDVKMSMPQINAKEDVEAMFSGEELSEEFKEKATTLFEAAVNAKVIAEMARIEEEYQEAITEELKTFTEEITDKLDAYLDYVVENWMQENEVAIESALRNELAEEFMNGLKNLFNEHYINIPESKVDVVETLANKVEELETKLNETILENSEMKQIISESAKVEILESLSEDLALSQAEKFKALSEGIEFDGNIETYEKKLRIIKETYFKTDKSPSSSNIEEEVYEGNDTTDNVVLDPIMNKYVQALTRTIKK